MLSKIKSKFLFIQVLTGLHGHEVFGFYHQNGTLCVCSRNQAIIIKRMKTSKTVWTSTPQNENLFWETAPNSEYSNEKLKICSQASVQRNVLYFLSFSSSFFHLSQNSTLLQTSRSSHQNGKLQIDSFKKSKFKAPDLFWT